MKKDLQITASILFGAVAAFAGVGVSTPTAGLTSASPVHVVASASMSFPVIAMQVYVDGSLKDQKNAASLNDLVAVASGTHVIVVQSWDNRGNYAKSPMIKVNVNGSTGSGGSGGSGGGTPAPSGAATYANIDQMAGWQNCGACAGSGGNGTVGPYSMRQNVGSPSMDGRASHFWLGGNKPYADALWWKQLGGNPKASHFIYDLYFYYTNAGAPQALEFDGNQSVVGRKYIFGTQCNVAAKQWDVWNTSRVAWVHTGVSCTAPPTFQWNHLVLEYERAGGQTHFIAITLNGKKSYINRYGGSKGSGVSELNVAFQMDLNNRATNYDVWVDKVNLIAW